MSQQVKTGMESTPSSASKLSVVHKIDEEKGYEYLQIMISGVYVGDIWYFKTRYGDSPDSVHVGIHDIEFMDRFSVTDVTIFTEEIMNREEIERGSGESFHTYKLKK